MSGAVDNPKPATSAPLAACGAILACLALGGLARGYDRGSPAPEADLAAPIADPPSSADPPDAGPTRAQVQRLLEERPMDINQASAGDLELLPRIGPTLAERILEERARGGPFRSVDDLRRVRGIGPRTVELLRPLATVDPAPVDPASGDPAPVHPTPVDPATRP
jgi:competence protein ComEA